MAVSCGSFADISLMVDVAATIRTTGLPFFQPRESSIAVIKQDSGQTAVTKPFGGDLEATTSGGKVGLKRTGGATGMIDSGISQSCPDCLYKGGVYSLCILGDYSFSTEQEAISVYGGDGFDCDISSPCW